MTRRQCQQIMNLSIKVNIWTRKRDVGHAGAVRIPGDLEEDFIPRGPEDLTPTRENICTRCDDTKKDEVKSEFAVAVVLFVGIFRPPRCLRRCRSCS